MKKALITLGSISMLAVLPVTVISCGNKNKPGEETPPQDPQDPQQENEYTPHRDLRAYPSGFSSATLDHLLKQKSNEFYREKGTEYFSANATKVPGEARASSDGKYVRFNYGSGQGSETVVMNFYELYDWAHDSYFTKMHPQWDTYTEEQRRAAEYANPFKYLNI